MLPVYVAVTRPGDGLVWLSWVAFVVGIAAVSLELAADTQMHRFVAERRKAGGDGPRAVELVAAPELLRRARLLVLDGPVRCGRRTGRLVVAVHRRGRDVGDVLGASIPLMEKRSLERRPNYQAVIDRVPRLVPRAAAGRGVSRPRVVIAGLGDSGLLTAIKTRTTRRRRRHLGQTGPWSAGRNSDWLARPKDWARDNWIPFDKFRGLDRVRTAGDPETPRRGEPHRHRGDRRRHPGGRTVRRAGDLHRGEQRLLAPADPAVTRRRRRRPEGPTTRSRRRTRSSSSVAVRPR